MFWKIWHIKWEVGQPPQKEVCLGFGYMVYILLMEEILHQLIGSFSHYFLKVLAPSQVVFSPDFLNHQQDGIITYNIYNLIWLQLPPLMPWYHLPGNVGWQDLTSTAGVAASFVGTANYMSPERALGKDGEFPPEKKQRAEPELKDEHLKMPGVVFLRPLENEESFTCEVNWE